VAGMPAHSIYETIRTKILQKLSDQLSEDLFYHSIQHTLDVETQAERIALSEQIYDPHELFLLKTACLYHDSGFMVTYRDHEIAGCNLVKEELPGYGFNDEEINIICGLIMATHIPQTPLTKLEEIICDADLDYLGRDDFFPISNDLFTELRTRKLLATKKDWDEIQVKFFNQHKYFTETNKQLREQQKQQHLEMIKAML